MPTVTDSYTVNVPRRLIQITKGPDGLNALDNYGDVWRFYEISETWEKLPGLPEVENDN